MTVCIAVMAVFLRVVFIYKPLNLGQRIFPVGMMGKALTHIMRIE